VLQDIDLPKPVPTGRDLLVEIKAISVNPVDTKVRRRGGAADGGWRVLGWDAAGVVAETGPEVTLFKRADTVFYAGALERQGTNAEFHLVDERIVGRKPDGLGWPEVAALPLTAITAWEGLFDRLDVRRPTPCAGHCILIIGGAGGVSSVAIQLAKQLTDLTVIGQRAGLRRSIGCAKWAPTMWWTIRKRWQQKCRRSASARRASFTRQP
jgi:NADPH2:quinone reductase